MDGDLIRLWDALSYANEISLTWVRNRLQHHCAGRLKVLRLSNRTHFCVMQALQSLNVTVVLKTELPLQTLRIAAYIYRERQRAAQPQLVESPPLLRFAV